MFAPVNIVIVFFYILSKNAQYFFLFVMIVAVYLEKVSTFAA